jgi:hypothetical protein
MTITTIVMTIITANTTEQKNQKIYVDNKKTPAEKNQPSN